MAIGMVRRYGGEARVQESTRTFGKMIAGATYVDRPGGYAIVRNAAGEVAVVSTPQGLFLPGGGQEGAETPEHAAIREAYEECSLRIRVRSRVGAADELVYTADEDTYYRKRCSFFSADVLRQEGQGEANHDLLWISPK